MPLLPILLLFLSALLHTAWNFLLKQAQEISIATWWVVIIGSGIALLGLPFTGLPPPQVWPLVVLSVFAEAIYFFLLANAYRISDFSLVYPIARGAAPAFLVVWSLLFLREHLTAGGLLGLALIILGLIIVGAAGFMIKPVRTVDVRGIIIAILIALLISLYTLTDGMAVKRVSLLPYALTVFALIPLPITPFLLVYHGWARLKEVWIRQGVRLVIMGLLGIAAYLIALLVYSIAPLSYSGAIREVTVVLGAFAGWRFLGEKPGRLRLLGALAIFVGIVLIAILG